MSYQLGHENRQRIIVHMTNWNGVAVYALYTIYIFDICIL